MNTQELASKINATYAAQLYRSRYFHKSADAAQDALSGRTHYADPETLRYFHSRILSAFPILDGLFFRITESCALNPDNTRRGYRVVLFDLFGTAVYRPDLENCRRTREAAEKDYSAWAETFNPVAHYEQNLAARADKLDREAQALRGVFETVEAE